MWKELEKGKKQLRTLQPEPQDFQIMPSYKLSDAENGQRVLWTAGCHVFTAIQRNLKENIESQHQHAVVFVIDAGNISPGWPFANGGKWTSTNQ